MNQFEISCIYLFHQLFFAITHPKFTMNKECSYITINILNGAIDLGIISMCMYK